MKLAIFSIADKEYGVDISGIFRVIRMRNITPIPEAADFVEGVISLRGSVIPLINLRKKLGFEKKEFDKLNRIVVIQIDGNLVGVIVDKVIDVISFDKADITVPDKVLKQAGYLIGVGKTGKRLILVIDMGKLISDDEKSNIQKVHKRVEVRKKDKQ